MMKKSKNISPLVKIIFDIAAMAAASLASYWLRFSSGIFSGKAIDSAYYQILIITYIVFTFMAMVYCGLYKPNVGLRKTEETRVLSKAVTFATAVLIIAIFLYKGVFYSRLLILILPSCFYLFLFASRWLVNKLEAFFFTEHISVLLVGAGNEGKNVLAHIERYPHLRYKVVGFLDDKYKKGEIVSGVKVLGGIYEINSILKMLAVKEVIVTLSRMSHEKILDIILFCKQHDIEVRVVSDLFGILTTTASVGELNGIPLLGLKDEEIDGCQRLLKRFIDIIFASLAVVILSPVLLLITVFIIFDSPGPVLYIHTRVGLNGKYFRMYKFRSMLNNASRMLLQLRELNEVKGHLFKIKKDPRITRVGRILRRYSLDELPQLFNVLKGDMSLIGPRPPIPREVRRYNQWHKRKFDCLPGITGLWQVSGRNELSFEEMIKLDLYYIENWSLWLDLRIAVKTFKEVVCSKGAY